jgi:DNA-binding transcriptional LysR family regulator
MAPRWSVQRYLDSGDIKELMVKPKVRVNQNKDLAIYLLYQKQQYLVPKVKVAVDFLVSRIKSS